VPRGRVASPHQAGGGVVTSTRPACIREMRSAALGFVMKWDRREIVDVVAARQVDQLLPEGVPGDRIRPLRWVSFKDQQIRAGAPAPRRDSRLPHPQRAGHRQCCPSRPPAELLL